MPLKFNPFSGSFDFTGTGGGGASYIDGEVQNFSALPETLGTPPVDSAYLVREAEGTWLLNRRPAGIYIRTANTGTRASDWTHAGAFPDVFNDANFILYDNADSTKNLAFQLSGITTGTTRTLTVPDASGTLPLLETANTFSANQTFSGTNNVMPNQTTAASGSSIMTRDLSDARYAIYETIRPENNQTAADAANFYSFSATYLPLTWIPARIEIHAELEFTTTPLAAGTSNFRFRLSIRDVEGASMNSGSNSSIFNSSSVTNVTGDRYIIKGEISSFPATWSTRLASHGTIFLTLGGEVWNYTGGSLTLVNNQDRRVGYRIYR